MIFSKSMYKLRPYQQKAVDYTIDFFKKSADPVLLVLPTGAGKSLVIAELARIARGRVLVLAHVRELVEQNHRKYESYGLEAGIYSAGLNRKETTQKVIFGSIQSVARANQEFFKNFSLLIIDECHRVSEDEDTQYSSVILKLTEFNPTIRILGLTATPFRLGIGWIYEYGHNGTVRSTQKRFFKRCLFELSIEDMIREGYLTKPVKIDIPVTSYDFSELTETGRMYTMAQVEALLKKQKRLTPLIIKNVIDITESDNRQGVMIFSSTVKHAEEILGYLPEEDARIILGETESSERDKIIEDFKKKRFKYLVNVSVLTTGFDAPHVDVIAILRPTESVSLYQQIIGRGLRPHPGKEDCYVLDYTGVGHDIYAPEIADKKPTKESVAVQVLCPECGHMNDFWGVLSEDGEVLEHYGRKCQGATLDNDTLKMNRCDFLFRSKSCPECGESNDVTARECSYCNHILIDADSKLKQARLSKGFHILKPDSVEFEEKFDKNRNPFLNIKYYDHDGKYLSEFYFVNNQTSFKKFRINFLRSHLKRPELNTHFTSFQDVIQYQGLLRKPLYVIARKQDKFWKVTEKIFVEEV